MGLGDQCRTPFIVDFGLAQKYRHATTGIHIPFRQVQCIRGTLAFSSIHSHLGAEIGRHDDLESLAYTLIYLVRGSLPWLNKDKRQQASSILEMKQKIPVEVLCHQAPCKLATFLTYTHTLSFSENPNYSYIRSLFGTLRCGTSNLEHGPLFDLLLPASFPLESECRPPTPPPTSQCPGTSCRCGAVGTESTPCHKASRAAQQHQPESTAITPNMPKCRYATTNSQDLTDHFFILSLQFTTLCPTSCQNPYPT